MEMVLATRNAKKVEEMNRILQGLDIVILSLDAFPSCPEVEEDQATFGGNAEKKALTVARHTGKAAMADDSGLVVDSLDGAPGVLSARYSGEGATDESNVRKLLSEMESVPDGERTGRFVCSIALAFPVTADSPERVESFAGVVEGVIGREVRGRKGFGYDPLFYPIGFDRTFAEMDAHEKDGLSHRGKALEKLKTFLRERHGK
ncbi:MAG: RdgB/HAM1 family non-canonical purine NTP pyrophosphatase [Nitrospirales bacterium]|nr:RdgB/HAM1 family non-canonical purine NTP pyrophosphatase [Nitrospirales bacterium]